MYPTASVSGLYFAHPGCKYFSIGRLQRDQVSEYANRLGKPLLDVERMIPSHLA
jgi:5-methyltetrahydrofolate--homocysteine methyltransferase